MEAKIAEDEVILRCQVKHVSKILTARETDAWYFVL